MSELGHVSEQSVGSDSVINRARATCALQEFEQPLIRYVQMFVGNYESARDIVSDAFLKLCQQKQPLDDVYIKPWLFKVCRNGAIDFCRKEKRVATSDMNVSQVIGNRETEPASKFEQTETLATVMKKIGALSNNQQEVLRLKFQSGFSYQEIADVTGLTKSNVGVLLHTALTKLRQQLVES